MASKRPNSDGGGPSAKRHASILHGDGPVSSAHELNKRTLRHQNRKLVELIEVRKRVENDLRDRISQLEQRLTTDDDVLMCVNRYWNQLDEDVRVLLQRFDAEAAMGCDEENTTTTAFLTLLSTWDKSEMNEKLQQRVGFSKRAVSKLVQAFDRLLARHNKLISLLDRTGADVADIKNEPSADMKVESGKIEEVKKDGGDVKKEAEDNSADDKINEELKLLREETKCLMAENMRLQEQATSLHHRHHETTSQFSEMREKIERLETEMAEMKNKCDDLEYERDSAVEKVHKSRIQINDLHTELAHKRELIQTNTSGGDNNSTELITDSVQRNKFDEMKLELETQTQLAESRLSELENLQHQYQQSLRDNEQLTMNLNTLPENVIFQTTEYKCLKSQYSVLFNEAQQIKTQLEEARSLLGTTKTVHNHHIEKMESDELNSQKKIRSEMLNLEDALCKVRREYELNRVELEQTQAANEQAGPINREMSSLIRSLRDHHRSTKNEILRYKRMYKTSQDENTKLKDQLERLEKGVQRDIGEVIDESTSSVPDNIRAADIPTAELIGKKDAIHELVEKERLKGKQDKDIVASMKQQLKKAQDSQREMKLLLDMYKSAPREQRDKVQLMAAEKKAKSEIDELKEHIKTRNDSERKEKRKLADGEALKKIKKYEEQIQELKKEIVHQKQEEEELLKEMEVTGSAYEEKQEQNIRLVQQLQEKDDANLKLMSESIKSKHVNALLREENDTLQVQIVTLNTQKEAMNGVIRRLEDKERLLQSALTNLEKELVLRQQGMESFKRKAMESAQTAADLKLHLEKYHSQLREAQTAAADKATTLDQQSFKYRRMAEELASVKRKLERAEKIEQAGNTDQVLLEEIREYKEQLTCPSCKVKKKDAVLTKCFHVFCLECLKTRYETRQRKCPKCNAAFGANDYHRIYIS